MPEATEEEKKRIKAIVDKYDKSFSKLVDEGTREEGEALLKYLADQANYRQRKLVGLED